MNNWTPMQTQAPDGVNIDASGMMSQPQGAQQNAYPTLPNDYNLGSQIQQQADASTSSNKGSVTVPPGQESSRGFNPWSLIGESNAR